MDSIRIVIPATFVAANSVIPEISLLLSIYVPGISIFRDGHTSCHVKSSHLFSVPRDV